MTASQVDVTFRVRPTFGPEKYIQMVQLLVEGMFFDEETQFELMIKKNNDERLHDELTPSELVTFINPQTWPDIQQILFANPWMKGMNLKFQFVRRHDYISLLLKCEMTEAEHQTQLMRRLEEFLLSESYSEGGNDTHDQERERLFGSMLMNSEVIRIARQPFLAGRFKETISSVLRILIARLETLLHVRIKYPSDVVAQFNMEPPKVLLPDLSGKRLQEELVGIGNLCAGILILTKPLIQPKTDMPDEPAKILKWLVMIGMVLERLEGAAFNPALQVKNKKESAVKVLKQSSKAKKKIVLKKSVVKKGMKKTVAKKKSASVQPVVKKTVVQKKAKRQNIKKQVKVKKKTTKK